MNLSLSGQAVGVSAGKRIPRDGVTRPGSRLLTHAGPNLIVVTKIVKKETGKQQVTFA
jgi:hypothetical protein